jgi:hypothetical protein
MATPLLIMVGADKGGVGKTTVSRALLDYLTSQGARFRAFDTEYPYGVLKRFHPRTTEIVDLTQASEQMKVFDTLTSGAVTVIDVRAGLLSPTLKTLTDIGLLDMVRGNQLRLAIFHVLGPTMASLQEIQATADIVSGSHHFLVKNHINGTDFFAWDKGTYESAFRDARSGVMDIPQLNELACEHIENNGVTYNAFINNEQVSGAPASYSMVLRGYTRTWLKDVFAEFDKVALHDLASNGVSI